MSFAPPRALVPRPIAATILVASLCSCHRSGGGGDPVPGPGPTVEAGDPIAAPRLGYAGSEICAECHRDVFDRWKDSLHYRALRGTHRNGATGEAVVADSDGDGIDDFREGLDLSTVTNGEWTRFGAGAPRLSFQANRPLPYQVTIGALTYDVQRTYGGNGVWKQRYVTLIGQSHYLLPIQWNEASRAWVPYRPEDWYDVSDRPRFTDPNTLVADVEKAAAFEVRCAGCHNLGLVLSADASSGGVVAGYRELSNGCESCHGPGATHVARGGGFGNIVNPRNLVDGSTAGSERGGETCGRCHSRGTGDPAPGTTSPVEFAWTAARGIFEPGNVLADYLTFTQDPEDYWGLDEDGRFVASRSNYQQWIDLLHGSHAPNVPNGPTCFDCHDPHGSRQTNQIRENLTRLGVTYRTRMEDDTLCFACHHGTEGRRDFRGVSDADVQAIARGELRDSVRSALVLHLANAGMPVTPEQIDPTGDSQVGRCTTCHQPLTMESAESAADQGGFTQGDVRSHTFDIIHPNVSFQLGVTNSCSATGCHPLAGDPNEPGWQIITEWAQDSEDEDGRYHASTPRPIQNGQSGGGLFCVQCHTTEGFVNVQVEGRATNEAEASSLLDESIARRKGVTCQACHGADSSGVVQPNSLRFPLAELCTRCHFNQGEDFEIIANQGGIERHPQLEMLSGRLGGEVPGQLYNVSGHTDFLTTDSCATCHVVDERGLYSPSERGRPDHRFEPKLETCILCHRDGTIDEFTHFDRLARDDYDGNGLIEGIQTEVLNLLDILTFAILEADPRLEFDEERHFTFMGSPSNVRRSNGFSDPVLRAIFNVYFVDNDQSRGVHNAAYTVQLLQRSYREVTGEDVPGATIRND